MCLGHIPGENINLWALQVKAEDMGTRERMVSWDKKSSKPDDYMGLGEESSEDIGSGWRSSTSVRLLEGKLTQVLKWQGLGKDCNSVLLIRGKNFLKAACLSQDLVRID